MFAGVRAIAAALAMVSVSFAAVAQGVPPGAQIVPPSDQPGRERERFERPPVPLAQPGGPTIAVPGIEAPAGAAETMLVVRQIRVEGATVYTSAQLAELYADLIGHKVTLQAVYDAAGRITAKYGADGYVLSRAIIPVQELDPNGAVVRIQVLEGYVETVEWPAAARRLSRFLLLLRVADHRRAAGEYPHHRALSPAGRRPAGPEIQEQPQAASDQGRRGDPGGRGDAEAGRHVQPRRQPRHPCARPARVPDQHHRQQLAAHARGAHVDLCRRVPDPRAAVLQRHLPAGAQRRRPDLFRQCQLWPRIPRPRP